ncbi:zinc dependent phospholipase C family protein [Geobacter sp. FeAm09]|uniref:zinc dependent phospholipase C family protein n=1 Tax=Geobacter sp. FeAm09 TaxID=2597769 RepID=UPI0011F00905|nr:zinc dependent phospholipase C family protein [Geobacter sp. FeAm09]QEM69737.1 zinc dependent phospholipase C family protein [Geobacter sp. FeAm09]
MFPFVLLLTICGVLVPDAAHAWGGGIHLQAGLSVLSALDTLPPAIGAVLAAYPRDYLYGCIAADIIVGKKYTHYLLNCHRWRIGQKVLQAAHSDGEKACAYGYLSHLAADGIAHNYFVPYKIMRSFASVTMKHTYWEMRFETFADKAVWERAREICTSDQRANDAMLRSVLTNTIFSFGTNKRIFNSIMLLSRLEKWQKVMRTLSENSRYTLAESDRDEYMTLTEEAVFDFLRHPEESDCLLTDPTGEKALAAADALRKNLRLLYKNGRISKADGLEQVDLLKHKLRQALHKPELLKGLHRG